MRILYFSDNASDHNRRFLAKLGAAGHEVHFLDLTTENPPDGWLPRGVRAVLPKITFRRDTDPGDLEGFLPELRRLLRELQPDLVHAGPVQGCGYLAALSGFHPLTVMSWGSDVLTYAEQNAEWRHATETALRAADGFLCDCEAVRNAAQRLVPISDARVAQFPWGIERGSFSPAGPVYPRGKLGLEQDAIVFLCTRSWEPLYGIDILLQAFHGAYRENNRLRLVLLGDGSAAGRIRRFIAEHGLREVVLTPGIIPRSELPRWFRMADAYISSARSDGTSISLLEAMATGLPVVVTDTASNREWITEGEHGWLASVGNPAEFAEKIRWAASLTWLEREEISERNRRIVKGRADWDENFPSLLRLYECLAAGEMVMKA